jgi:hypothetical protein
MKSLFLILFFLHHFQLAQADLIKCMVTGKDSAQCKNQQRLEKRMQIVSRNKKQQELNKAAEIKQARLEWEAYYDSDKNQIMDKKTGEVIDLRQFSLRDREIVRCQVKGGNWRENHCQGGEVKVSNKETQLKAESYLEQMFAQANQDKTNWDGFNQHLEAKEKQRFLLKDARETYRKLLKYGMNVVIHDGYYYVIETNGELVPVDQYKPLVVFQEAMTKGHSEQIAQAYADIAASGMEVDFNKKPNEHKIETQQPQVNPASDNPKESVERRPANQTVDLNDSLDGDEKLIASIEKLILELQLSEQDTAELFKAVESGEVGLSELYQILLESKQSQ